MRFLAFILILVLAIPAQANENLMFGRAIRGAWGGTVAVGSCPYGASDPCTNFTVNSVTFTPPTNGSFNVSTLVLNAGASNFAQYATSKTYGVGSNQTWAASHPWTTFNEPAIDYNIGYSTSVALKDPTNSANLPSGCSYSATGANSSGRATWPAVTCSSTSNLTVSGLDFSSNNPSGCVTLVLLPNVTGTVTVTNNHFSSCTAMAGMEIDASMDGVNDVLTVADVRHQSTSQFPSGITDGTTIYLNDYTYATLGTVSIGHGVLCSGVACTGSGGTGTYAITPASHWSGQTVSNQRMAVGDTGNSLILMQAAASNIYVYNNVFEGYGEPTNTQCNGYPCLATAYNESQTTSSGYRVFAYNAVVNMSKRPMYSNHFGNATPAYRYITANYFSGIVISPYGDHGEILEEESTGVSGSATVALQTYNYNVLLTPNYTGGSTSILYLSDGFHWTFPTTPSLVWTSMLIDHNLIIGNQFSTGGTINSALIRGDGNEAPNVTFTNNYLDQTGVVNGCIEVDQYQPTTVTQSGNVSLLSGNSANIYPTTATTASCP